MTDKIFTILSKFWGRLPLHMHELKSDCKVNLDKYTKIIIFHALNANENAI